MSTDNIHFTKPFYFHFDKVLNISFQEHNVKVLRLNVLFKIIRYADNMDSVNIEFLERKKVPC